MKCVHMIVQLEVTIVQFGFHLLFLFLFVVNDAACLCGILFQT